MTIDEKTKKQIDSIKWENFETAYGNAKETTPDYLKNIYNSDEKIAMKATHHLWCSLCHQHAYISSASLPAYEIIKDRIIECNEKLKIELLDIMYGFAACSNHKTEDGKYNDLTAKMKRKLLKDKAIFKELALHKDEEIKDFAESILEELELTK